MNPIRRFALALLCAAHVMAAAEPAAAQDFPNKPITLICPWPAGGTTDQYMRALAQIASKYLGQSVVVDNKPGAGGTLGAQALPTTTKPEGYTLSQIPISVFRFPYTQKTAFDPTKDYARIALESIEVEKKTLERLGLMRKE